MLSPTRFFTAVTSAALCVFLAGCGGPQQNSPAINSAQTASSDDLTVITPHAESIRREFEALWKQKHPESPIHWQNPGGSSDLMAYVLDQYSNKADKNEGINADVFFGGGIESFVELEGKDLLEKLPSDYGIPAELNGVALRGKDNAWVGAALSGFGILYNKKIADRDKLPTPVVWADLGKKELWDRIELADPRKSGSAHVAYEIILQTNGWEKGWKILAGMAANSRTFLDSSSQLVNDVSSGEAVFVPSIDFYARAKMAAAGKDKVGYIVPAGQSVVTPDPIGILRGAQKRKLAEEFVAMVMSPEGQKLWMLDKGQPGGPKTEALFRQAILPGLYKPLAKGSLVTEDPYAVKNARPYDYKKATARRQVIDDLIGAILIDNHDALHMRQKSNGDIASLVLAPTEAEVTKAAARWDMDPIYVQQQLGQWRDGARNKISNQ